MIIKILRTPAEEASHTKWIQHFRDTNTYIFVVSVTHTCHLLPLPWHIYVRSCNFRDAYMYVVAISVIHIRTCLRFPWHTSVIAISVTQYDVEFPWLIHCVVAISVMHTSTLLPYPWHIYVPYCDFHDMHYAVAIFVTRKRKLLTLASRCLSVLPSQESSDLRVFATPNIIKLGTLKMRFNFLNRYN
jgi:hypothetical protein